MKKNDIKKTIENKYPCKVGFVKARIFNELQENLEKYKKINHDLQILENTIDNRINPYLIYKDVKTIIVIIFPYETNDRKIENSSHVVSRSSWGVDYHLVIKEKLNEIKQYLKTTYNRESIVLTDNHPLHERHLAYLAGLGNYGKNTLLIHPLYGSFFFIGLILTDLELEDSEYDKPKLLDICKNCNRCIKACPTEAISENGFINVNRCMSYLTQSKKEIPEEYLSKFTKFTFGCDFCQLACVYNSNVDVPILEEFKPIGKEIIHVKDLKNLSNKSFKEEYQTLSASFRGKNVLLRNALLVSANQGNEDDLNDIDNIKHHDIKYLKQAIHYAKNNKGEK